MNVTGDRRRNRRALKGLMYLRIRILDVTREPGNETEAETVFDTNKSTVVEVPSVKEGLDEVMGLPDFSTQLYDFLMHFLLSSFEKLDPFVVTLF